MIKLAKSLGSFEKNIILVFLASTVGNVFNLLYQLLIAHRLSAPDFAAFNSLLSIFLVISAPLVTVQTATSKYIAEFSALNQPDKTRSLLSVLLKKSLLFAILTFIIFFFASFYILNSLKISHMSSGYILAIMLALSWIAPVLNGGLQGLELFKWLSGIGILVGLFKLGITVFFLQIGWGFSGALGAFLLSVLFTIFLAYPPLRHYVSFGPIQEKPDLKEFALYIFPLWLGFFCFSTLISSDMILVKLFFSQEQAGVYSLAQMLGKIFLFLPGAISLVLLPRTCGLNSQNLDTCYTLRKSLLYAGAMCVLASLVYNIFPSFVLTILTGKALPESILLGRLFSISMIFFALLYIFIVYFLSLKDFRFIKYLLLFTGLQCLAIVLLHQSLFQVQLILCINSVILFLIHLFLFNTKQIQPARVNE